MSETADFGPVRPRRTTARVDREGDAIYVRYRPGPWGTAFFLLLWLTGWTVGCVLLAEMVIRDPKLFHVLFAVPFWAAWFFVFAMLVNGLFRLERLMLNRDGLLHEVRVFLPRKLRDVPLAEVQSFEQYSTVVDSESRRCQWGLEVRTLGLPLRCLEGLSGAELDWLQSELNRHLRALRGDQNTTPPAPRSCVAPAFAASPVNVDAARAVQTLSLADSLVAPPSDCRWTRLDGFDDIAFARRGALSLAVLGGLLFVNLFWNGVVSVFVLVLWGGMPGGKGPEGLAWWGLFFFLIPFEGIGLVLIAGLVAAVFEPFHRTVWTLGRQSILRRETWFGIGPRWNWDVLELDRVELGLSARSVRSNFAAQGSGGGSTPRFRLAWIDRDNVELCAIDKLTEGEARWIADVTLRERSIWFPRNS